MNGAHGFDSADAQPAGLAAPWTLRQYSFLGDGERGALVGPRGELVWLCAPRWDSEAVFGSLIGAAGEYRVGPQDDWNVWGGYYEDGSLVHVNRWTTAASIIECREALAMPAAADRLVLLRRVRAVHGQARVRMLLDARPGFGRYGMAYHRHEGGLWTAEGGGVHLRLTGAEGAGPIPGGGLRMGFSVPEGGHHDLVLEIGTGESHEPLDADRLWRSTERRWHEIVPDCSGLAAPRDARHAYAVLNGMTSSSGGMVAAATTSLPERAEAGRNYDYRFAWIRDQVYAALAVAAHGPHPLFDAALRFVTARILEDGAGLRPAYTVSGGRVPEARSLSLPGYPGGGDQVGNSAAEQFQLDVFGEALQLYAAAARLGVLGTDERRAAGIVAEAIEENWQRPDSGLWELENRWWTHSRLAVVAGLSALAGALPHDPAAEWWTALARTVMDETRGRCLRPEGHWVRAEDDNGADAALLLALARGCVPPDDPGYGRTRAFVRDRLAQDGYLYRFRHGDRPLEEAEGAFLLCGLMMALAAHRQGDKIAAFRWFERTRAACGPPALFAEEYDVGQRQLRGNIPQAFVHALLLEAAVRLAEDARG